MTRVTVLKEESDSHEPSYRAVGGRIQTVGRTMGEALDALASQLPPDQCGTLIIVRDLRADIYFPESKRRRLDELMTRWRDGRDSSTGLPDDERKELERLVDEETEAATARAAEAWRELVR